MTPHLPSTTDQLLACLRHQTGIEQLHWATPPRPLTGGFWAEMYTVELADAPSHLTGPLVARIMPDPATAAFETAIQRHVYRFGLSVPAIRAVSGPTDELARAWMLMDHVPGRPPLAGLGAAAAIRRAPGLYRRLPDQLARAAVDLHRCPITGPDIDPYEDRANVRAFLARIEEQATAVERDDLAMVARHLDQRAPDARVLCHGDLHPFNPLVDGEHWALIDWSAAVIADPQYDLAFTTLLLSHPPLGGPAVVRIAAHTIGKQLARRFLKTYSRLSDIPVDNERMAWGRSVHALRALTEIATWDHEHRPDAHRGHPWLRLRGVLETDLAATRAQT